ncbi:MAG: hypothetical protein ACXWPM_06540 [Bdellovibrionota bacterium]
MKFWILLSLAFKLVVSRTHLGWNHPDEWFQTVEFANLFVNGRMTWVQETDLHLRNLTLPMVLTIPLYLAKWIAPTSVALRIYLVHLYTGILDLGVLWGMSRFVRSWERRWQHIAYALVVLPFFAVGDSVRAGGEHYSAIAAWVALGLLADRRLHLAGVATVLIAAVKYPAGLFSAGIALGVLFQNRHEPKVILRFAAGVALGLVLFGIPDWIIYGRPWESLWMYLQYNLFTGLAVKTFGAQPLREYWEFLGSRWMGTLAPWGIPLAGFAFLGILPAIGAGEPWAYAAVPYLVPHLMVTHKEGRFLAPLEPFLIWAAVSGLRAWLPKIPLRRARVPALRLVAGAFLAVNAVLVVRILWGELYRTAWIYTEVTSKLQNSPDTCAVITVDRRLPSSYYPRVANLAIFVAERDPSSLAQAKTNPLVWSEHLPSCTPDQKILLQVGRVDDAWNAKGCELLPSGILKILPRERWEWAVQNHVSGSVWYRCPSSVTALFARQSVEHPFVTSLTRLAALPPIGTTSDQILKEFPVKQRYYSCLTLCD